MPLVRSGVTRSWIVAVDFDRDGGLQQPLADGPDDVGRAACPPARALATVGERERQRRIVGWTIDHASVRVAFFLHRALNVGTRRLLARRFA